MSVNLGNPIWITLIADGSTPAEFVPYNGAKLAVPEGTVLPTSIDSIVVNGVTVWGYARGGTGGPEWVMQPALDPNVVAVNAIPGGGGWQNLASRQVFYDIGLALLQLGVPGVDLRGGLLALYNASVNEYQTRTAV